MEARGDPQLAGRAGAAFCYQEVSATRVARRAASGESLRTHCERGLRRAPAVETAGSWLGRACPAALSVRCGAAAAAFTAASSCSAPLSCPPSASPRDARARLHTDSRTHGGRCGEDAVAARAAGEAEALGRQFGSQG